MLGEQAFTPSPSLSLLTSRSKSQLAIEFAHQVAEKSPNTWIFWIHAATRGLVDQGFRTIADSVHLPGRDDPSANIPLLVSNWLLNPHNGQWVMVIDSADDQTVFYNASPSNAATGSSSESPSSGDPRPLASYLPQTVNGSILVTTRDGGLAFKLTGSRHNSLSIGAMTSPDALQLLETRLACSFSPDDRPAAEQLVEALERIPLAISQAAGYIQQREPRMSVAKYLGEFQKGDRKRARLLEHDVGDIRRDGAGAVLTTWTLSFEQIRRDRESASDLLAVMSFFEPQDIPAEMLKEWWVRQAAEGCHSGEEYDDEADDMFEDDITLLRNYSLVAVTGTGAEEAFSMHALVQLSTRRWIEACGIRAGYQERFLEFLLAALWKLREHHLENWPAAMKLLPHIELVVELSLEGDSESALRFDVLRNAGGLYRSIHEYGAAERLLREAQKVSEQVAGRDAEMTLYITQELLEVMSHQSAEVEDQYLQTADRLLNKLGPRHWLTLQNLTALATWYSSHGRSRDAEEYYARIQKIQTAILGPDHPEVLTASFNLADIYYEHGKIDEADRLASTVWESYNARKGSMESAKPWTLVFLRGVAVYIKHNMRDQAQQLSLELTRDLWALYDNGDPHALYCLAILAKALRFGTLFLEASALQVEVLDS